ncbi:glycosyltransferase [Planococcus sp. APC 4015]|nr:glycosyltransferase [Planococcus sp. APC 4015]
MLSLYEGFFAGGARVLHTDLIAGLHARGFQQHRVLSLAPEARRESTLQPMTDDARYLRLQRAGIAVRALGRIAGSEPPAPETFTEDDLRIAHEEVSRADVILSLKEQPLGLLLALAERGLLPRIPVAVTLHRSDPLHSGSALRWLVHGTETGLVTSTIACAHSTSEAYAHSGVRALEPHVIPNGIDTERFRPATPSEAASTRRRLGIPASVPVVVFAARFDAMKNPGLFLASLAAHATRRPDTHYVLCGAGMEWSNPAFRGLARQEGVMETGSVHTLGIRDDMPAVYQIADIVALTSAFGEASPLCLLEGAACGATPVTTDVGDAARQIEGFGVITSHDPTEIADAWETAILHRDQLRSAALAARGRIGRERMIDDYSDAISGMLTRAEIAA